MRNMVWLRLAVVALLAGLLGCRQPVAENPPGPPEDEQTRLGDKIDISLADWLNLPRAELAKMADEYTTTVEKQQEAARLNAAGVDLLPQLHAPVRVPIFFNKCTFAPDAGISLPRYLLDKAHDPAIALHLARYGDHEAALKLVPPDDKDLRRQIESSSAEKNYPLEWTRLVALALQVAQFKMAHGDPDGATELVLLHAQLREVLDPKALKGPLGAALLPIGRHALELAVTAWRDPKANKLALAGDIEAELAKWGEAPEPMPGLLAHTPRAEVARLFGRPAGSASQGRPAPRAICAVSSESVARALDLLALPMANEGVNTVAAFLDPRDRLDHVLVVYHARINELFPEPTDLAYHLLDLGISGKELTPPRELPRLVYQAGGLEYDVRLLTRGNAAGALVQVAPAKSEGNAGAGPFARDPRDWGAVHLDRTFEANRVDLDPAAGGTTIRLTEAAVLQKISQPVRRSPVVAADLARDLAHDLVSYLALTWPANRNHDAVHLLGPDLWAAFGPPRWEEGHEEVRGGCLELTWEAEDTRIKLRLPYDEQGPDLVIEDSRGNNALAARAEAARQRDRKDRRVRLSAGKPQIRLPRSFSLNAQTSEGLQADGLMLGMGKDAARATLPSSQNARSVALKDGLSLVFTAEPSNPNPYWARQLFIRFGPGERVAEIRIRYQEQALAKGATLLQTLVNLAGAPEELAGPWGSLWTDLGSSAKPPILYRWRDDVTLLTLQRDAGGAEVILKDCPPDSPFGAELGALEFCSRGTELCSLGDGRDEVRKRHNVAEPQVINGAELLREPEDCPYDVLLVEYDQDRVSRIIARHRTGHPSSNKPQDAQSAIVTAWGQDLDHLGYPRRVDEQAGQVLAAYGWHDDVTRVRIFVQDTQEGPRLFTEFRSWPLPRPAKTSGE